VLARRRRDIDALRQVLPGAAGFRLSEVRTIGDEKTGSRNHSSGGHSAGGELPAQSAFDLLVAWMVMTRFSTTRRRLLLTEFRRALRAGGTLLVVDHNRPRTWGQRLTNLVWCVFRGVEPCTRPACAVAQEVKDAAFVRISVRMAVNERIQIVRGIRPPLGAVP